MASIYKRGNAICVGFYDVTGKHHSRSLRISPNVAGWAQAREIKKRIEVELKSDPWGFARQTRLESARRSLTETFDEMLASGYEQLHAASTVSLLRLSISKFTSFVGDLRLHKISASTMLLFRNIALARDGEVNTACWLRHLSIVFSYAVRMGAIGTNPIGRTIRLNPPKKHPVIIRPDDLEKIWAKGLEMWGPEFVRQCQFLLYTGFRAGDSCAFKRSQIDFEMNLLVYKNQKKRRIEHFPIYSKLVPIFEPARSLEPDDFVFHYRSVSGISHAFRDVVDKLKGNPDYNLHGLKRNFVTRLVLGGTPPALAHQLAHHTDFKTTLEHYTAWDLDLQRGELERVLGQ